MSACGINKWTRRQIDSNQKYAWNVLVLVLLLFFESSLASRFFKVHMRTSKFVIEMVPAKSIMTRKKSVVFHLKFILMGVRGFVRYLFVISTGLHGLALQKNVIYGHFDRCAFRYTFIPFSGTNFAITEISLKFLTEIAQSLLRRFTLKKSCSLFWIAWTILVQYWI